MQTSNSTNVWLGVIFLLLNILGCSHSQPVAMPSEELFPVHGKLLVNGSPANGASVKFLPAMRNSFNMHLAPGAIVDENGEFRVSTKGFEDGMPLGDFVMTVFWLETPSNGGMPVDRLNGKFSDPNHAVAHITVQSTANDLGTFNLTID